MCADQRIKSEMLDCPFSSGGYVMKGKGKAKTAKKPVRKMPDLSVKGNKAIRGGTSFNYGGVKNDY
jgi:hypothetical protein